MIDFTNFINQFPYQDFHEMNLDWILKAMKQLASEMNDFEAANSVSNEGIWNISKQYSSWSIVQYGEEAYLSTKPVPSGVPISNTDYWMKIGTIIVDQNLNKNSINAISNKAVTEKFISTDSSISNIENDIDNLSIDVNSNTVNLNNEINTRTSENALINARIDEIATLPEGSTSGDAELIDIRTGANGITYSSAGNAVRGQFTELEGFIDDISEVKYKIAKQVFDPHPTNTGSTSFRGFATRYSYTGYINKISFNGRFSSDSDALIVDFYIYDGNFEESLYHEQIAVDSSNTNQWLEVTFDDPFELSGDFYVAFKAATGNVASVANNISSVTTATTGASSAHQNKYLTKASSTDDWQNCENLYCIDTLLYVEGRAPLANPNPNIKYVGSNGFDNVQDAIDSINDDSSDNPYVIIILPGTYPKFKLGSDNSVRYISLFGFDPNNTIIFDNKGNYTDPPANIRTNGTIQGISFINRTDATHYDPDGEHNIAYAVHIDFGTCKTSFINCYFESNAGPAIGAGTWSNTTYEFVNCRFISDTDGTYGATGQGAFFCHTKDADNITNQKLILDNCTAIAKHQTYGSRLAVIGEHTGSGYDFEIKNYSSFGSSGSSVSITDPDNDLISPYSYNNLPSSLNKAN